MDFFYEEEEPSKSEIENEHEDENDEEHQHQATLTLTTTTTTTNKYYERTPWRTSERNYDNELQTPKREGADRAREQKKGGNPNRNPNGRGLT